MLTLQFSVCCEECGDTLDTDFDDSILSVTPCESCMADSYESGQSDGPDKPVENQKEATKQ